MSKHPKPGAVVFAKDLACLAKFYAELLSMAVVRSAPDHVVLESPHIQLVIHAIPEQVARAIVITSPPERRTETPIKLLFPVDSLSNARATAARLGGALNPPEHEWDAAGVRACDGHDPEGNVLQLRTNIL
ncbi:MAG: VOC family protein [Pseudomonadota bacterium]